MSAKVRDERKAELARIHIGAQKLGMDDDVYRDMLWSVALVRSAADLDAEGRQKVLAHLRGLGFEDRGGRPPRPRPSSARRAQGAPDKSRMEWKVRELLKKANRDEAYADAMAKRMYGTDKFTWLKPGQLHGLVAALVIDADRHTAGQPEQGHEATR